MFDFRIRDQGKKKIFLLYGSSSRMGPIFDCLNLLIVVTLKCLARVFSLKSFL